MRDKVRYIHLFNYNIQNFDMKFLYKYQWLSEITHPHIYKHFDGVLYIGKKEKKNIWIIF